MRDGDDYQILHNGVPRTFRDQRETAYEAAIDDLPHQDPRAAFVAFTRTAHRNLGRRISEIEQANDDQNSWRTS